MQIKIRDPDLAKNGFKRTVRGKMLSVTGEKLSEGPALPQPGASVDPWPAIWKRWNKFFLISAKKVELSGLLAVHFMGALSPNHFLECRRKSQPP